MMYNPLVSIIIPTFNSASLITETMNSVVSQTFDNWECIVVDDGSNDDTKHFTTSFVNGDARIQYFERPQNRPKGANACRNIGIENAKGTYLIFLDSDDLLSIDCVENRLKLAVKFPKYDFYVFNMGKFTTEINDSDELINRYAVKDTGISYLELFLANEIPWPITSLFVKKENLDVTFDEDLQRFQDVLFSIKLLIRNKSFKVFRNEQADCFYRLTNASLARIHQVEFIKKVNNAYKLLLTKIVRECKYENVTVDYKNHLVKGFMNTYQLFIFPKKRLVDFIGLGYQAMKYNILPFKRIFLLAVLLIYNILGLQNTKGLGYYTFSKILR